MVQQLDDCPRYPLDATIVGGSTAYPVENIKVWIVMNGRYIESLGPVESLFCWQSPRIPRALLFLQGGCRAATLLTFTN